MNAVIYSIILKVLRVYTNASLINSMSLMIYSVSTSAEFSCVHNFVVLFAPFGCDVAASSLYGCGAGIEMASGVAGKCFLH